MMKSLRRVAALVAIAMFLPLAYANTASAATASVTSLAVTPATTYFGGTQVVSGRLMKLGTITGIANASISIQYRVPGGTTWSTLTTVRTNATGNYTFSRTSAGRNLEFRAAYHGSTSYAASASAVRTAAVRPWLSVNFAPASKAVIAGNFVTYSGSVKPYRASFRFNIEEYTGGKWVTRASSAPATNGTYLVRYKITTAGAHDLRLRVLTNTTEFVGYASATTRAYGFAWHYLVNTNASVFYDMVAKSRTLNAKTYLYSMYGLTGSDGAWAEYDLKRGCTSFSTDLGINDGTTNTSTQGILAVTGDDVNMGTYAARFGATTQVRVDVTGYLRLRVQLDRVAGTDTTAITLGNPAILCRW